MSHGKSTSPIFVRGLSRSGGTLMATVLDAHPDVAMCYEIYEHLLAPGDDGADKAETLRAGLAGARGWRKTPKLEDRPLQTFTSRVLRGGVDAKGLLELLEAHLDAGLRFDDFQSRMRFVERIATEKARREGKRRWGAKIASVYDALAAMYPDAGFLFMLRDGRDIAASRQSVGQFGQEPAEVARTWAKQIDLFQAFAEGFGPRARLVRYERLTEDPRAELEPTFRALDLAWDDRALAFHEQDLTLFRNPAGHLSADQLTRPINASSVGRWRSELSEAEVQAFEAIAGDALEAFGYRRAAPVS